MDGSLVTLLSYQRLATFRDNFSREVNTMRKDLSDADAVYDRLRKAYVTPWCPPEVATVPVVREFLRSLYLSGNGALIFGNSFVEWSASEAFRRARPSFVMAQFGVRSKPKPFSSVAVFENPDEINPLPSVDDLPGSSLDAQILALYVWLAAIRYQEYQRNTVCLCIAESICASLHNRPTGIHPLARSGACAARQPSLVFDSLASVSDVPPASGQRCSGRANLAHPATLSLGCSQTPRTRPPT